MFQKYSRAIESIDSPQDQCSKTITKLIESIHSLQDKCSRTIAELAGSIDYLQNRVPNYGSVIK